jgi:hypothetical protein
MLASVLLVLDENFVEESANRTEQKTRRNGRTSKRMRELLVMSILLFCGSLCHSDWQISVVDSFVGGNGSAVAVDSSGIPRVAYCIDTHKSKVSYRLRYALWDSIDSMWKIDFWDTTSRSPRLKLDSKDLPHIVSVGPSMRLSYTHKDTNRMWHVEPIDWYVGSYSPDLSFDFDSQERIHVVYPSRRWWPILVFTHSYRDTLGWHAEPIDSISCQFEIDNEAIDCVIDNDDIIHVVYEWPMGAPGDNRLRYAKKIGETWHKEKIGAVPPCMYDIYPSIAIDTSGCPCVAYSRWHNYDDTELRFARKNGSRWDVQVIERTDYSPTCALISHPSLCIDRDNLPRICYITRCEDGGLKYAWFEDSQWNITMIDTGIHGITWGVYRIGLVIDDDGISHISYGDRNKELQKYARGHGFRGVEEKSHRVRVAGHKLQASPNPFVATTVISYQSSTASKGSQPITLSIYDISGQLIKSFPFNHLAIQPFNQIAWDAHDAPAGVYFVKLQAEKSAEVNKLVKTGGVR